MFLELRDIGIENFQILSTLFRQFSYSHFVFTWISGRFLLISCRRKNSLATIMMKRRLRCGLYAKRVTFSPTSCFVDSN